MLLSIRIIGFDHRKLVLRHIPPANDCPDNIMINVNLEKSSSSAVYEYFASKCEDVNNSYVSKNIIFLCALFLQYLIQQWLKLKDAWISLRVQLHVWWNQNTKARCSWCLSILRMEIFADGACLALGSLILDWVNGGQGLTAFLIHACTSRHEWSIIF